MFRSKLKTKYIGIVDGRRMYELKKPLVFNDIFIPKGFKTDLATIPESLQWLYKPSGRYSRASVLHDYLYEQKEYTKEQADIMFYEAMKSDNVSFINRKIFYLAVKYYGEGCVNA